MSQPDVAYNFRPTETKASQKPGHSLWAGKFSLQTTPRDHGTLLRELEQAHILNQQRISRIHHLEQALDQALVYLDELKAQLQNQTMLETQLAKTENFANVQQKAVARLQQRLCQQSQALEVQVSEIQTRDQALSDLQTSLDSSQQWIANLEAQLQTEQADKAELETQLAQAKQDVQDMSDRLNNYQAKLSQLEQALAQLHTDCSNHQNPTLALPRTQHIATERDTSLVALQKELAIAQIKVEELEIQLAKQMTLQARWQHAYQEAETTQEINQSRIQHLEQQGAEMQEQIFQHAKQSEEYEAAVQYWKDRCLANQQQLTYFKQLAVQVKAAVSHPADSKAIALPAELSELLNAIEMLTPPENTPEATNSAAAPAVRLSSRLDLPGFLMRRRNHRANQ